MNPDLDLRRVQFSASGLTVEERWAERLELFTDDWFLSLQAEDYEAAENSRGAMRQMARLNSALRLDELTAAGGPTITRLLSGIDGSDRVMQVQYVVWFGEICAFGVACPRDFSRPIDPTPIDRLILSMKLTESPRPDVEVLPAWRAYQRQHHGQGSPIAKFRLSAEQAPTRLGGESAALPTWKPFTMDVYQQGGRQLSPGLLEFYASGDGISTRLDAWLEEPPPIAGREVVFGARLDIHQGRLVLQSFDLTFDVRVPPGEYDVFVTLVNRGRVDETFLTDTEVFARDDLERLEVWLRHRDGSAKRP